MQLWKDLHVCDRRYAQDYVMISKIVSIEMQHLHERENLPNARLSQRKVTNEVDSPLNTFFSYLIPIITKYISSNIMFLFRLLLRRRALDIRAQIAHR